MILIYLARKNSSHTLASDMAYIRAYNVCPIFTSPKKYTNITTNILTISLSF
jgi:hypothetical protein